MKARFTLNLIILVVMFSVMQGIAKGQTPPVVSAIEGGKLPFPGQYYLRNCGFRSAIDNQHIWWACDVYPRELMTQGTFKDQEELKEVSNKGPSLWLVPVMPDGQLGNPYAVDL